MTYDDYLNAELNEYLERRFPEDCGCEELDEDGKCECELEAENESDRYNDYLIHSSKED